MRVYQAGDGKWIFWDGKTKFYFIDKRGAFNMNEKSDFCDSVRSMASGLIACIDDLHVAVDVGTAQEYKPDQSDSITDEDAIPNSAEEIGAFFVLIGAIETFVDNTVTIGDELVSYRTILNRLRNI